MRCKIHDCNITGYYCTAEAAGDDGDASLNTGQPALRQSKKHNAATERTEDGGCIALVAKMSSMLIANGSMFYVSSQCHHCYGLISLDDDVEEPPTPQPNKGLQSIAEGQCYQIYIFNF